MDTIYHDEVEFVEESDPEEDSGILKLSQVSQAVLNATDWTTETIIAQLTRGTIDLKPSFQRRDAWNVQKKSRFIESLILGFPIPQIVLAESKMKGGSYLVLDGKQRLLTLLQFIGKAEGKNNSFRLSGLTLLKDLNRCHYDDLTDNPALQNARDGFLNQTIRTVVIRNWPSNAFLHMVFLRLNTSTVPLSPQELRQALFPGGFLTYIDEKSLASKSLKHLLKLKEADFRMRDVELLLRYLAFSYYIPQYAGNMSGFLDLASDTLTKQWNDVQDSVSSRIDDFEKAIDAAREIFGDDNVGRKWTGDNFEGRLNRAVLDVIGFYFSDAAIRKAALENSSAVLEAFKHVCVSDDRFRTAIESATNSLTATYDRFSIWGKALSSVLPIQFSIPSWNEEKNRIIFNGFNSQP